MDQSIKERLLSADTWIRFAIMALYALLNYFIVQPIIWIISAIQLIVLLAMGKKNQNLLHFSEGLSAFSYHIVCYLTFITDDKPYPFTPWPGQKNPPANP